MRTQKTELQKIKKLAELNLHLLDAFKELVVPLMDYSKKKGIDLPQNVYYLIPESYRRYRNLLCGDLQETKQFTNSNLQFLEAIKELLNVLIAYSEKNGIPLPLNMYHLVFEAGKVHQSLISDEILQVDESDEDYTEPQT